MQTHRNAHKLSVCALSIAAGMTWALGVLFLGLIATYFEMGKPFVELIGSLYLGFEASIKGSFIGAGWAFVDGLIAGIIFACVYNLVLKICCPVCCGKAKE